MSDMARKNEKSCAFRSMDTLRLRLGGVSTRTGGPSPSTPSCAASSLLKRLPNHDFLRVFRVPVSACPSLPELIPLCAFRGLPLPLFRGVPSPVLSEFWLEASRDPISPDPVPPSACRAPLSSLVLPVGIAAAGYSSENSSLNSPT